jgi:cobalt/nickel transport protein
MTKRTTKAAVDGTEYGIAANWADSVKLETTFFRRAKLKNLKSILFLSATMILVFAVSASAHFAMIIPSKDVVTKGDSKDIGLLLRFTHPFEGGPLMQMDKPEKFGVVTGATLTDLLGTLHEKKVDGRSTWESTFKVTRPADYIFFLLPAPYWEPSEDKYIVHATKVIVDAFGAEEGWDKPVAKTAGLPAEIVPLSRPYSLYSGNLFTGRVFKDGSPAPDVDVEVEWWAKGAAQAPTDSHVRQVVKTDPNGVFNFAMPKAGWWGFSAIMEADKPIQREGKDKKVEIGAVIWIKAYPMQ